MTMASSSMWVPWTCVPSEKTIDTEARIHIHIDVGFGNVITPAATDLEFPTLLGDMPSPIVLGDALLDVLEHRLRGIETRFPVQEADRDTVGRKGLAEKGLILAGHNLQQRALAGAVQPEDADLRAAYPTETIVAEKTEAMVDPGISNCRLKDFTVNRDGGMARHFRWRHASCRSSGDVRRRSTPLPDAEIVGLSDRFVQDASTQANWKAFATRNRPSDFESLAQVVSELRHFLHRPLEHARSGEPFTAKWNPGGPRT